MSSKLPQVEPFLLVCLSWFCLSDACCESSSHHLFVVVLLTPRGCDTALVCRVVIVHQRVTDSACLAQLVSAPRRTASLRISLWWQSLVLPSKIEAREALPLDLSTALLMHMDKSSWRLALSKERARSLSPKRKELSTSVHSRSHVGGVPAFTCYVHQVLDTSRFPRHNR